MADSGWRELGYVYISIDDCWALKSRDSNGKLQPDPVRFPSGMKALADYVSISCTVSQSYDEDYSNTTHTHLWGKKW